jgi:NTE family protein
LYENSLDTDIVMVELTPLERSETPTSARNILNRINEIASINGLISELRALDLVNRNVKRSALRFHVVSMPEEASKLELEPSIKRTVGGVLFESLRQSGRAACERWLAECSDKLGVNASVDIHAKYLAPYETNSPVD